MTETAVRLRRLSRPHLRARALAVLLGSAGAALVIAAGGIRLAPRVASVVLAWLALLGVAGLAVVALRRLARAGGAEALGRLVEAAAGSRQGSVVALVTPPVARGGASPELLAAADGRAAAVVARAAPAVHA
ncbi:MAG: hypothetical protein ACREL9_01355, partial [Gemmatimonadales bacterium]